MVAPLFVALAFVPGDPAGGSDDVSLKVLADRCGTQIEWIYDGRGQDDGGAAFKYVPQLKPLDEAGLKAQRQLVDDAIARAKQEKKLVLWHAYRLEGPQMYRAPNLDDYMDEVAWSDPAVVALVKSSFVPLRTSVPKSLGTEFGILAWDKVEPALIFLTPDGKVAHVIDRIRTFDGRWFAEVLRRVRAAHPDCYPDSATGADAAGGAASSDKAQHDYYQALSAYYGGKEDEALAGWRALAESTPDSPYAWRAAANLIPAPDKTWPGAARHGFETSVESWLPPNRAIPTDTRWRRTPAEADAVVAAAVRWLLRMQRPDGSWNDLRYAYWDTPLITPNAWVAVTSLAATALNEWRDVAPDEVDRALARAEDFLFHGGSHVNAGRNEESYACAYRLLYLHRTLAQTQSGESRQELLGREQELADRLVEIQTRTSGQWAHEYDNAFTTAVMLDALSDVEADGVKVAPETVKRGIAGLEAARCEDGSFIYGGTHPPQQTKAGKDALKNACGRMPVCEAALFRREHSDLRKLDFALTNYQQYFEQFEKIHKCDFHTDGELGGFFFFHDLYHASAAMKLLPEKRQAAFKPWFVEKLTALPEIDGSFLDDHELGKSCGTAYALLALKNAMDEGSN